MQNFNFICPEKLKLQKQKTIQIKCISVDATELEHEFNHEWTDYSYFYSLGTNKVETKDQQVISKVLDLPIYQKSSI